MRCVEIGLYILRTKCTVRQAATVFNISKTTAHNDIVRKLSVADPILYEQVHEILEHNKADAHIRGGSARKKH